MWYLVLSSDVMSYIIFITKPHTATPSFKPLKVLHGMSQIPLKYSHFRIKFASKMSEIASYNFWIISCRKVQYLASKKVNKLLYSGYFSTRTGEEERKALRRSLIYCLQGQRRSWDRQDMRNKGIWKIRKGKKSKNKKCSKRNEESKVIGFGQETHYFLKLELR